MTALSDFESQLDAVVTALDSDDFLAARRALAKAEVYHHKMLAAEGRGGASQTRRASLDAVLKQIEALQAASGGGDYELDEEILIP